MARQLELTRQHASTDDLSSVSPYRIVLLTGFTIAVSEFAIMTLILPLLPHMGTMGEGIADTTLLCTIVSVALYLLIFRPLQTRLSEEQAAKVELGAVSERLTASVHELEEKGRETAVINEMDDLLQASRNLDDAYQIIAEAGERLFPGKAGGVMVMANSRNISELVAGWGGDIHLCSTERCNPDDCWALRRGQTHLVGGEDKISIPCKWTPAETKGTYACVPLIAQGQALGVACLTNGSRPLDAKVVAKLMTVSRHIAVALANLKLNETLHRQSVCDPLTGLFNRRYLQLTLDREVHRAKRRGRPLSVIMMDVDHFKRFNDDFGHEVGDLVLQEIAALLRDNTRAEDIVCRYGGEEFVLIMPETAMENARERAEEIRTRIERLRITHRGETLRSVTISQGLASFPDHGDLIEDVMKAADAALYSSKAAGRNAVTLAKSKIEPPANSLPKTATVTTVAQ